MKKFIITLMALALSFSTVAQVRLDMGAGASTQGYGIAELSAGYNFGPAFFSAGYMASLTRNVSAGIYLYAQVGHSFYPGHFFVEPAIGYASILRSTDHNELNAEGPSYSITAGKRINDCKLYLKINYCKQVAMLLAGLRIEL